MATQTRIINPDGTNGIGYLINGKTYKDAAGNERIDAGTRVFTNGGVFMYKGNEVSVPYRSNTYHDAQGNEKPAYIKDGKAYSDAGFTTPVEEGSIVHTNGGDFYKSAQTENGVKVNRASGNDNSFKHGGVDYQYYQDANGVLYVDPYMTVRAPDGASVTMDGKSYTNSHTMGLTATPSAVAQMYGENSGKALESIRAGAAAQAKAAKARRDEQISRLNARRAAIEQEYEKNNRASYNAYLNSVNPYGVNAEKLASLGLSDSGFAETTMARIGSTYQNAIAESNLNRANALLELELAIDDAYKNGDEQEAEIYAQMYAQLANEQSASNKNQAELQMRAADSYNENVWNQKYYDEDIRQFDETLEENRYQFDETLKEDRYQFDETRNENRYQFDAEMKARENETNVKKEISDADRNLERELNQAKNQRERVEVIVKYIMEGYSYDYLAKKLNIPANTLKALVEQYYKPATTGV